MAVLGANLVGYSDLGVSASATYYYRVRAYNGSGYSTYSNVAAATTPAAALLPAAPSSLAATAVSSSQVNLSWIDNSSNESGFYLERSTDGVTFVQIAVVGANAPAKKRDP
jgi:titin